MCGPLDSVLGRETGPVVDRFLTSTPQRFPVAKGPVGLRGVIVDVEESTGKALSIRRFSEDVEE
jgi:calcineurin-like phosphoesterase